MPTPLLTYLRMPAEPDVLTGRWRYVPRLSAATDHVALRTYVTCGGFGLGHTGASGAAFAAGAICSPTRTASAP